MKNKRRLTAMLLAGCLAVSSVPVAFAEDAPEQQQEQTTLTPEQQQEQVFALADQAREDSKAAAPTEGTCGENASWKLEGGTLTISGTGEMKDYSSTNNTYDPWYESRSSITKVVVEQGITSIGNYAFYQCSNLTQVSLPDSLESIGQDTFYSCSSLKEINIPNHVNVIKAYAFEYCSSLLQIDIPSGITEISGSTFQSCSSLKYVTIPDSVVTIGNGAFKYCNALKDVTIPDSVVRIGGNAFESCKSLATVAIPNSVVNIDYYAFNNCMNVKEVELADSVVNLGEKAFSGCTSLKSIRLSEQLSAINNETFNGCKNLTNIIIPDNVATIGQYAFQNSGLKQITLGAALTSISRMAFYQSDLSEIYFTGDAPFIDSEGFWAITATAYYPRNASGWEDVIQKQYSGNITWTPWIPGETPETDGNLITINDTWNQKNFSTEIPIFFHEKLFGVTQGSVMYKKNNGTGGHCYGMVATAISTWNKLPAVKTYNSNYTALNQVEFGDRSSKTNLNAVQFINYAHLSQMLPSRTMEKSRNEDNLQGLCDAVRNYLDKKEDAVQISVSGDAGGVSGGHALLALNIEDKDNESIIKVYDCNYPGKERELHLKKDKDGNFTGWYYDMELKWIARWSDSNGSISYSTQAKNLYRDLKRRGIVEESTSKAQAASAQASEADIDSEYKYLITANTDTLTVKDGQYTIKTDGVQSDNTEVLLPIGNGVSPLPDQEEEIDKKSVYNKFWAKTNENMTFSDIQDDSEITVAGEKEGVTAAVPANATVSVQVPAENQTEQKVQISSEANETISIEYFGENTNKELESVTVAGSSGGNVESSMVANKVNISGVTDLKITKDDRTVSIDDLDQKSDYQISSDNGDISVKQDSDGDGKYETDIVKPTPDPKPTTPVTEIFSDIYPTAWYIDYVQFVYDNGLMNGTSETTFEPETTLSRAMVAQILYNRAGKPDVSGEAKFNDVPKDQWYYQAVQWAGEQGIVNGVGDGKFAPQADVTREQLAMMLYNAQGKPETDGSLSGFEDTNTISDWAVNAVKWAVSEKIINGSKENGKLYINPTGNATRAEAATMFTRYDQEFD